MGAFRKAFSVFCLGFFALTPAASVSQWIMVEPAQDYYIDLGSLQRQGETVTYRGKYKVLPDYFRDMLQDSPTMAGADYLVERNQINCKERTMRFVRDVVYNGSDKAIISQDYPLHWYPILPDTVAEDEWRFVCSPPPPTLFYSQLLTDL